MKEYLNGHAIAHPTEVFAIANQHRVGLIVTIA
jgi:hypothetical protein